MDRPNGRNASIGLCATCRNARVIESKQGSHFYLCRLSGVDPRFPKYPRLPVLDCEGYEGKRVISIVTRDLIKKNPVPE